VLWYQERSRPQAKVFASWSEGKSQIVWQRSHKAEQGLQEDSRGTRIKMPVVEE
jgi:hypothetical protein